MPAAAVIPAPLAYIKVVAVKKLVVECLAGSESAGALRVLECSNECFYLPVLARLGNPLFRHLIRVRSESASALSFG